MSRTEAGGLTERRRALLAQATGDVLEIGGGTGVNAPLLPTGIRSLTITEPEAPMHDRLARRLAERGIDARLVAAPAERLPFDDGSFDTVVSTLVLCTVGDPAAALGEVRRVLRPDGRLLFIEHVRAVDEPARARLQDRVQPVWGYIGHGCHCNRDTEAGIRAAGFALETVDRGELPAAPGFLRPLIAGVAAVAPSAAG